MTLFLCRRITSGSKYPLHRGEARLVGGVLTRPYAATSLRRYIDIFLHLCLVTFWHKLANELFLISKVTFSVRDNIFHSYTVFLTTLSVAIIKKANVATSSEVSYCCCFFKSKKQRIRSSLKLNVSCRAKGTVTNHGRLRKRAFLREEACRLKLAGKIAFVSGFNKSVYGASLVSSEEKKVIFKNLHKEKTLRRSRYKGFFVSVLSKKDASRKTQKGRKQFA